MAMVCDRLPISSQALMAFCRKYRIKKLSVFGSMLRGDSKSDSDVDLLVEFLEGYTPGFQFAAIEDELSDLFQREVDLHTAASLSRYFRDAVLKEAEPIYVAEE